MAAIDPNGQMQFWFNGLPFAGIKNANDSGEMQFWFNGFPNRYIFPASVTPTPEIVVTTDRRIRRLLTGVGL